MKRLSLTLPLAGLMALSACMNSGSESVTRAKASTSICAGIPHMNGISGMEVRCGPQSELPYTLQ